MALQLAICLCTALLALQQLNNSRVVHGTVNKLLQRETVICVHIHLAEDFVCSLLWRCLVIWHLHRCTKHLVDCLHHQHSILLLMPFDTLHSCALKSD